MSSNRVKSISAGLIGAVTLGVLPPGTAGRAAESGAGQGNEQAIAGSWIVNEDLSDELRPQPGGRDRDGGRRGPGGFGDPGWGPGAASAAAAVSAGGVVSAAGEAASAGWMAIRSRCPDAAGHAGGDAGPDDRAAQDDDSRG